MFTLLFGSASGIFKRYLSEVVAYFLVPFTVKNVNMKVQGTICLIYVPSIRKYFWHFFCLELVAVFKYFLLFTVDLLQYQ